MEHILAEFGPELRRRAVSDGFIRTSGLIYYVITVLAPELAVMLIQENMKVCKTDPPGKCTPRRDIAR